LPVFDPAEEPARMPVADLPLFAMLRARMQWNQERQRVLAENVANADTPDFKARDLAPLNFESVLQGARGLTLARTDTAHLSFASSSGQFAAQAIGKAEVRPGGNAVNLEDEMMKVASNQMDYQAAISLYSRSMGLFRTALGKR
jgi:flagellar basal-body rod protein FlgB